MKEGIKFVYVETVDEVLHEVFKDDPDRLPRDASTNADWTASSLRGSVGIRHVLSSIVTKDS